MKYPQLPETVETQQTQMDRVSAEWTADFRAKRQAEEVASSAEADRHWQELEDRVLSGEVPPSHPSLMPEAIRRRRGL